MARVSELSIGCSRVINLGNYENIKIEASVVVLVDVHESITDVIDTAQQELRTLLEETYKAQYRHKQSLL